MAVVTPQTELESVAETVPGVEPVDPFAVFRAELAALRTLCPNTGTSTCNDGTGCPAC